jgi:hypothetical protein
MHWILDRNGGDLVKPVVTIGDATRNERREAARSGVGFPQNMYNKRSGFVKVQGC